jgi:hypothetical protein
MGSRIMLGVGHNAGVHGVNIHGPRPIVKTHIHTQMFLAAWRKRLKDALYRLARDHCVCFDGQKNLLHSIAWSRMFYASLSVVGDCLRRYEQPETYYYEKSLLSRSIDTPSSTALRFTGGSKPLANPCEIDPGEISIDVADPVESLLNIPAIHTPVTQQIFLDHDLPLDLQYC